MALQLLDAPRNPLNIASGTAGPGEIVFAVHNIAICQYVLAVKSRVNFNIRVHNIVEIYPTTCLSALLRKIYTGCTQVSALLEIYFPHEGICAETASR
jgi:hypothetical protein